MADSYVIMTIRRDFDLVEENEDGSYSQTSPINLPDYAYRYGAMITQAVFPDTRNIGAECFKGCESLKAISMPKVETIGDGAFHGCESLATLSENTPSLTTIGNNAFQNCTSLTINYASTANVQTIGHNAFQNCQTI